MSMSMRVNSLCVWVPMDTRRGQTLDPLELEIGEVFESPDVDAGNPTLKEQYMLLTQSPHTVLIHAKP